MRRRRRRSVRVRRVAGSTPGWIERGDARRRRRRRRVGLLGRRRYRRRRRLRSFRQGRYPAAHDRVELAEEVVELVEVPRRFRAGDPVPRRGDLHRSRGAVRHGGGPAGSGHAGGPADGRSRGPAASLGRAAAADARGVEVLEKRVEVVHREGCPGLRPTPRLPIWQKSPPDRVRV